MMKEVTVVLKNLVLKGHTTDSKGSFQLMSSGDIKITADPDTVSAMAQYLEEVIRHEN